MNTQKFHGVHLTEEDDSILRLYARLYDIPLSALIRNAIKDWIEKERLIEGDLIQRVVRATMHGWDVQKIQQKGKEKQMTEKEFVYSYLREITLPEPVLKQVIDKYETYKGSAIE